MTNPPQPSRLRFTPRGHFAVVAANDGERFQSSNGTFYIHDRIHKTLVLAKRLLMGETEYKLIEALYLVPRPE